MTHTPPTMSYNYGYDDTEKNPKEVGIGNDYEGRPSYVHPDGAVPGESFEYGNTFYARAQRLAGKLKIEQRGIERVPEDERTDRGFKALLNVSTMVRFNNQVILWEVTGQGILTEEHSGCQPTWS